MEVKRIQTNCRLKWAILSCSWDHTRTEPRRSLMASWSKTKLWFESWRKCLISCSCLKRKKTSCLSVIQISYLIERTSTSMAKTPSKAIFEDLTKTWWCQGQGEGRLIWFFQRKISSRDQAWPRQSQTTSTKCSTTWETKPALSLRSRTSSFRINSCKESWRKIRAHRKEASLWLLSRESNL